MKKLYAALLGSMAVGSVAAQMLPHKQAIKFADRPLHRATPVHSERGTAIWSDDFSDPSTWTMGGTGGHNWVIGNVAPAGSFPSPAIQSTTAANGWAIYDSDLYCATSDDAWIQNVTPIDLTGHPVVQLRFEELYRKFNGQTFVDVSNDGINYTPFVVNSTVATNASTTNPNVVTVPISSVAGNQGTVFIRIHYKSVAGCDYAWQVDDVSIEPVVGYNLGVVDAQTTVWDFYNTTTFDSLPYTVYPISEIRPLGLNMRYTSNGMASESSTATITTTSGYSQSSTLPIAPSDTLHFYGANYTPPASAGVYNISYTVTGANPDIDTSDNHMSRTIEVSDNTFGRDEGSLAYLLYGDTIGSAFKVGNMFHVINNEMLYSIDAAFYTSSQVGSGLELNAQLLEANTSTHDPLAESQYHTLVTSELSNAGGANFVHFIFNPPVQLTAGTDYLAVIQHFGGVVLDVGGSGVSPAQTSLLWQSTNTTWYYVTQTPMVRMNFDANVGIAASDVRNGVGLGQNIPNPANNGSTRIDFSLEQSAAVTMELRDVSGKLVKTLVAGNMAQGPHHVDVNTAELGTGVYFYTLTTGKSTSTKRMTVVR